MSATSHFLTKIALRDAAQRKSEISLLAISLALSISLLFISATLFQTAQKILDQDAKALLGSDLQISSTKPISEENKHIFTHAFPQYSEQINFYSMLRNQDRSLLQFTSVIATKGDFPYYGELSTSPENAKDLISPDQGILVQPQTLEKLNLKIGSSVWLGKQLFKIVGSLDKPIGSINFGSTLAPQAIIAYKDVQSTGLISFGSRVRYSLHGKGNESESFLKKYREQLQDQGFNINTPELKQERAGNVFNQAFLFLLGTAAFALFLCTTGMIISLRLFALSQQKILALLLCLGTSPRSIRHFYLVQFSIITLLTLGLASIISYAALTLIPIAINRVLSAELTFSIESEPLIISISTLLATLALSSIEPLRKLSHLSGAEILRQSQSKSDPVTKLTLIILLTVSIVLLPIFSILVTKESHAFGILGALLMSSIGILFWAILLRKAIHRYILDREKPLSHILPLPIRLAFSRLVNASLESNSLILIVALASSCCLMSLSLGQSILDAGEELIQTAPFNNIVFDIQNDQIETLQNLSKTNSGSLKYLSPVVPMRITHINEITAREYRKFISRRYLWTLRRDYRSTYRETISDTEKLLFGNFPPQETETHTQISATEDIMEHLHLKLGDVITFDVQGVTIKGTISSVRKVNWLMPAPNFYFIFPKSSIGEAPQTFVATISFSKEKDQSSFLRNLGTVYPNISVIEVSSIYESLSILVSKISQMVIGVLVLLCTICFLLYLAISNQIEQQFTSSYRLLHTLGASPQLIKSSSVYAGLILRVFSAILGVVFASILLKFAKEFFRFEALSLDLATTALLFLLLLVPAFISTKNKSIAS